MNLLFKLIGTQYILSKTDRTYKLAMPLTEQHSLCLYKGSSLSDLKISAEMEIDRYIDGLEVFEVIISIYEKDLLEATMSALLESDIIDDLQIVGLGIVKGYMLGKTEHTVRETIVELLKEKNINIRAVAVHQLS